MPAAARLLNVGRRSITRARDVLEHGDTAVVAAVEAGQVSVWDAAKIAGKPKNIQQAALAAVQSGEAKTLAGAAKKLECEALPLDALSEMTDAQGNPLPEKFVPVFAARDEFMAIARKLDEDRRAVEKLAASPAGFYLRKELARAPRREVQTNQVRRDPYRAVHRRTRQTQRAEVGDRNRLAHARRRRAGGSGRSAELRARSAETR